MLQCGKGWTERLQLCSIIIAILQGVVECISCAVIFSQTRESREKMTCSFRKRASLPWIEDSLANPCAWVVVSRFEHLALGLLALPIDHRRVKKKALGLVIKNAVV